MIWKDTRLGERDDATTWLHRQDESGETSRRDAEWFAWSRRGAWSKDASRNPQN